jgi:predicted amidohydrolase
LPSGTYDYDVMAAGRRGIVCGVVDLPNVMSKFIMFGMPLSQIIAGATLNAARCFPSFDDRGTLNVGAPADVAILELRDGTFEFLDNYRARGRAASGYSLPKPCSRASA